MRSSNAVRREFIDFFVDRQHRFVPSSGLVPADDPTLLFVNSGMVQFKDVFLGTGTRPYVRAANSQKCLRVSGKHNDLEDVGRDTYHHTFFEMLGFWSFGDYFKRDAIAWLWTLLTEVWGLPADRLYAAVFGGDEEDGLARDDEAADLWADVTNIGRDHIQFWGKKDNFWEMADTGPCGPTSEIHIDLTPDGSGAKLVNLDDPRVIELGNIVFMQFNRDSTGKLTPLPNKHVDFGGGFERLLAVLQGKTSNYDTDLFAPIFDTVRDIAGCRPYTPGLSTDAVDVAYRVIADHLRCLTFAITDGVTPSNDGRGYVLRRILRRAVRHGRQTLSIDEPFLFRLVDPLVALMGEAFPELAADPAAVSRILHEEEESFSRTLSRGITLFEQAASRVEAAGETTIPAGDVFRLYDTYGFPADLTRVMAEERGLESDLEGFEDLMAQAREISRAAAGEVDEAASLVDVASAESLDATAFVGFASTSASVETWACVCRPRDGRYERVDSSPAGEEVAVALGTTPFYAQAGGQVGDRGSITWETGRLHVRDTIKVGNIHWHLGVVESGTVVSGHAEAALEVDRPRRDKILANHTGTHLMNLALRKVLGLHVDQKGSLVDEDKLRFDLSHPRPVTDDELATIESRVNADISAGLQVYDAVLPLEDAHTIRNLRAVFGEKYSADVRVVSVGVPVDTLLQKPDDAAWDDVSIELCGGTHLSTTAAAEDFAIVSEEAVAKGIRRIVAVTREVARDARTRAAAAEALVARAEGASDAELDGLLAQVVAASQDATLPLMSRGRLREPVERLQQRRREIDAAKEDDSAAAAVSAALAQIGQDEVFVLELDAVEPGALRKAAEHVRSARPTTAVLLGSVTDGKLSLVAAVPPELVQRGLRAGEWVASAAAAAGGRGGGRPDIAQGGSQQPERLPEALGAAREHAATTLGS